MENPFLYFYSFISVSIELLKRYCISDCMCITCEVFTGLEQLGNLHCLFAFLWLIKNPYETANVNIFL